MISIEIFAKKDTVRAIIKATSADVESTWVPHEWGSYPTRNRDKSTAVTVLVVKIILCICKLAKEEIPKCWRCCHNGPVF